MAVVFTLMLCIGSTGNIATPSDVGTVVILHNTEFKVLYSPQTASVASYEDDEYGTWVLDRAVWWDSNNDASFTADELVATTITSIVHYTQSSITSHFSPLDLALQSDVENPTVIDSGWGTEPTSYASAINQTGVPLVLSTGVDLADPMGWDRSNYFGVVFNLTSTSLSALDNVQLSLYLAVDVGDFYNDVASVNTSNGAMVTVEDINSGRLVGMFTNSTTSSVYAGDWGDGPDPNYDVWQMALEGNNTSSDSAEGDVDVHIMVDVGSLSVGQTKLVWLIFSSAWDEVNLINSMNPGDFVTTTPTTTTTSSTTTETSTTSTTDETTTDEETTSGSSSAFSSSTTEITTTSSSPGFESVVVGSCLVFMACLVIRRRSS